MCNCLAFFDKTKKVSTTILLDTSPDFQSQQPIESVLCSKCKTQTTKGLWPSWSVSNYLCPDYIPVELASLCSDEVRTISLICPFLKVINFPGGQFGEGSVFHFPFQVQHVMTQLPCPLNQSELILSSVVVPRERTSRTCCPRLHHALNQE